MPKRQRMDFVYLTLPILTLLGWMKYHDFTLTRRVFLAYTTDLLLGHSFDPQMPKAKPSVEISVQKDLSQRRSAEEITRKHTP